MRSAVGKKGVDMVWRLIKKTQDGAYNKRRGENEMVYHYHHSDGRRVVFHSHPTRAFVYIKIEGTTKDFGHVTNEFVMQGFRQRDYEGGFDEAISALKD